MKTKNKNLFGVLFYAGFLVAQCNLTANPIDLLPLPSIELTGRSNYISVRSDGSRYEEINDFTTVVDTKTKTIFYEANPKFVKPRDANFPSYFSIEKFYSEPQLQVSMRQRGIPGLMENPPQHELLEKQPGAIHLSDGSLGIKGGSGDYHSIGLSFLPEWLDVKGIPLAQILAGSETVIPYMPTAQLKIEESGIFVFEDPCSRVTILADFDKGYRLSLYKYVEELGLCRSGEPLVRTLEVFYGAEENFLSLPSGVKLRIPDSYSFTYVESEGRLAKVTVSIHSAELRDSSALLFDPFHVPEGWSVKTD